MAAWMSSPTWSMPCHVPPLSPISAAANAGHLQANGQIPDVSQLRIPVKYLANMLTAGDEAGFMNKITLDMQGA